MPPDLADGSVLIALLPLPLTLPLAAIDLRYGILPDRLNAALFGLGLAAAAWLDPRPAALAWRAGEAAIAFGLLFGLRALHARLRGRVGFGLGDVKFIGAATAWTGLVGLPWLVLTASVTALGAILVGLAAGRRIASTTRLPFGPFLVVGLHTSLLAGHIV